MIRRANAEDLNMIQECKTSIIPFDNYTPNDIKETYVYTDRDKFGFLCTTSNMKHIVAVGGNYWTPLIRYFYYHRFNKERKL